MRSWMPVAWCAVALALTSCGNSTPIGDTCRPGDTRSCPYPCGAGNNYGVQLCQGDGTFGACHCVGDAGRSGCAAGTRVACPCDAQSGTSTCRNDGTYGPCVCGDRSLDGGAGDGGARDAAAGDAAATDGGPGDGAAGCTSSAQCAAGTAHVCDVSSGRCVECLSDGDCSGVSICNRAANVCIAAPGACRSDVDCPAPDGGAAFCDTTIGAGICVSGSRAGRRSGLAIAGSATFPAMSMPRGVGFTAPQAGTCPVGAPVLCAFGCCPAGSSCGPAGCIEPLAANCPMSAPIACDLPVTAGIARDVSPSHDDATVGAPAAFVPGRFGSGVSSGAMIKCAFNGCAATPVGGGPVTAPGTGLPIGNAPVTLEGWIQLPSPGNTTISETFFVYGQRSLGVYQVSPASMTLSWGPNGGCQQSFNAKILDGSWHFVAATYDSATVRL